MTLGNVELRKVHQEVCLGLEKIISNLSSEVLRLGIETSVFEVSAASVNAQGFENVITQLYALNPYIYFVTSGLDHGKTVRDFRIN